MVSEARQTFDAIFGDSPAFMLLVQTTGFLPLRSLCISPILSAIAIVLRVATRSLLTAATIDQRSRALSESISTDLCLNRGESLQDE
jgi:hypothetical protein